MTFLSSRMRGRVASFAVACAVWLSASSAPLPTEAAEPLIASHALTQFMSPVGENVRFNQRSDGSIEAEGSVRASAVPHREGATPLDLFNALEPGQQVPLVLREGNAKYLSAKAAVASLHRVRGNYMAAQAPGPRLRAQLASQQWFINAYCHPLGSSYTACYAPAWGWAYLNSTGDSYGHTYACALTAPLQLTVGGVGTWTVPTGWCRWVYVYGFFFNFNASVANAQYFDFEADVRYTWPF
jgi:hypothetical protein